LLNRAEWTLTQFAAARAGLVLVTINPAYRLSELEQGRLRGARHRDPFKSSDYIGMIETLAPELAPQCPAGSPQPACRTCAS
jgi:fatty-acyl-CoA synthase